MFSSHAFRDVFGLFGDFVRRQFVAENNILQLNKVSLFKACLQSDDFYQPPRPIKLFFRYLVLFLGLSGGVFVIAVNLPHQFFQLFFKTFYSLFNRAAHSFPLRLDMNKIDRRGLARSNAPNREELARMTATGRIAAIPPPARTGGASMKTLYDGVHPLRGMFCPSVPRRARRAIGSGRNQMPPVRRDQSLKARRGPFNRAPSSVPTPGDATWKNAQTLNPKPNGGTHDMDIRPAPLHGLSLCAGAGGLDLGIKIAEPGFETVCFVERDARAAATLVGRMADAYLGQAPVYDDVKSFDGRAWRGRVHIILAGYPCQPFSTAGKRRGANDPRHLWPDIARIIGEVEPAAVLLENVAGHLGLGFYDVARELCRLGYRSKAGLFSAAEVGAGHERQRLFVLAYADGQPERQHSRTGDRGRARAAANPRRDAPNQGADRGDPGMDLSLGNHDGAGPRSNGEGPGAGGGDGLFPPGFSQLAEWAAYLAHSPQAQPGLYGTADGLAGWMDRGQQVGNGVCSLAAAHAFRTLKSAHARDGYPAPWESWARVAA